MYRSPVALKSKLSRLAMSSSPLNAAPVTGAPSTLDDLRAKMHAILDRPLEREGRLRSDDYPDLPFVTEETDAGPLHVRIVRAPLGQRVGRTPVFAGAHTNADLLSLLALDPSLASCDLSRALYLDTETTGLSGGAGTVAFLVGLLYWREDGLGQRRVPVLEQILVRNLGEEAPMLVRIEEHVRRSSMLVTFNGKSFDWPLLRNRYTMARLPAPTELPHLDLVHVARRLHRARKIACKLQSIERNVLGFERHDDVPSSEVGACYLHFLRTGDTHALLKVVEHNAWDVYTMAALVGLYGEPLPSTELDADDLIGVASTLKRAGQVDRAFETVNAAVDKGASPESLKVRAQISKARGDKLRALEDYESFLAAVEEPSVRLELAKIYEHTLKAPGKALDLVRQGTGEVEARAEHRERRLLKKIEENRQPDLFRPASAARQPGNRR